jgi:hypothetical protein
VPGRVHRSRSGIESRKSLLAKLRRCSGHPELYLRSLPE